MGSTCAKREKLRPEDAHLPRKKGGDKITADSEAYALAA